jgi:thymidylate synthase ThyX
MSIEAKIILDSLNPHSKIRLVTMELTYPRFIHAEFMTHRLFSRNAASSRAIPITKMLKMVHDLPAMPVSWGKNQKGMSAEADLKPEDAIKAGHIWLNARNFAITFVNDLNELGLHKQIANRIIEPWQNITVICSATHWSNFFRLRDHKDAQPEIQALARAMKRAQDESTPVEREWHIPYIQPDEMGMDIEVLCKIGTARCARVSYLTHDGKRDINKDLELHQRLLNGSDHGHWSPFEHVAKAHDKKGPVYNWVREQYEEDWLWCGNFQGWTQYRKLHSGEHLT